MGKTAREPIFNHTINHHLIDNALIDPVNPHIDQLIDAQIPHPPRAHVGDVFRGDVVNPHRNQLVGLRMRISQPL